MSEIKAGTAFVDCSLPIVCVGLPRTGTQSMADALTMLGYSVLHEAVIGDEMFLQRPITLNDARGWQADVVMDSLFWDLIVEAHPQAKVILTYRPRGEWWRSIHGHIDRIHARCTDKQGWKEIENAGFIHGALFGSRWPQEGLYLHRYDLHRKTVEMFCEKIGRPLLIHQSSDGWEPLCKFLGLPVPSEPYPHRNASPMGPRQAIEHRDG